MVDLFLLELKRIWIVTKRYPMELVSGFVLMTLAFYALFAGVRYVSGPTMQFGEELDGLILGYCLWSFVLYSVNGIALGLQSEALTGTLEQVYMSPFGALRILFARSLAALGIQLGIVSVMLLALLMLTGRQLSMSPMLVFPLATVFLAAYGIGLLMAALALVFKRIQQLLVLVQFVLLFLVAAPVEKLLGPSGGLLFLLPVAPGAAMLRELMVRGAPFDAGYFALAFAGGASYLALGTLVYRWAEQQARRRGLLGHY